MRHPVVKFIGADTETLALAGESPLTIRATELRDDCEKSK